MQYEKKQGLLMFPNKGAGKPMVKSDGSMVVNSNTGEVVNQCDYNGKITLLEGLPAGDYEVNVYRNISKNGNEYMSGKIKKAWVKPEDSKQAANQPDSEENDQDIPF
jgi:hypothetical protein